MRKLLLVLTILSIQQGVAQSQDAWVFFADKENVEVSLADPILIMTQEAIDRKELHGTAIDERDVPVNENYITQIKNATGITVRSKSKWMNCVYIIGSQPNIEALLDLPFVTNVEYADKSLNLFPGAPIENKFSLEEAGQNVIYNYGAATNQIEMLSGDYLHELDYSGEGMIVAVLDAGFPSIDTNPGFQKMRDENRILGTYDFEARTENVDGTSSHGFVTSSDIGGFLQNEFVGTAPQASFYFFVTEYTPSETPVEEAWWVEALERSDSLGVDVVNTSLGYRGYDNPNYNHTYEDLDGQTTFSARGANIAFDKGMILVTSAGNGGNTSFPTVGTPGDSPGTLTVGAVNSNGIYVAFSSIGPTVDGRVKPDVMAQGSNAAVINTGGNIDFSSGTSFSSPIMAGVITCLWQSRPDVPNGHIMQIVRESANLYNNPTDQMGYGIPNFENAYLALQELGLEDDFLMSNFALYPNPVTSKINISFPEGISNGTFTIYSILGNKVLSTEISRNLNSVNMESLNSGMYIASINSNNKQISFKIIKE
ncbi:S8 family serine peptidase [Flavobacteriaceae bacterium]|jgi:serine protease AprX|nr:S8 family serine peptidase [Flavobacteriaceae bacterium]MDB9993304.1 S8 family serine peptidase [Flavobacteriaceae bacterium]